MVVASRVIGAVLGLSVLLQPATDVSALRDKLDAYLLDYQPKLSTVVATETITQELVSLIEADRTFTRVTPGPHRKIESEVSFGTLPGDSGWLGFRRVRVVNGKKLPDTGPATEELLRNGEKLAVAKQMLNDGARHNLGSFRNTNLPNLPLWLLHPRNRSRFEHTVTGTTRINGTAVTVIVAKEKEGGRSLIRDPSDIDMPSTVTAWVDADGRLLRAEVKSRPKRPGQDSAPWIVKFVPTIEVRFRFNRQLDILVPVEMREGFWSETDLKAGTGVAKYKDFRRFQTSARIVPQ